MTFLLEEKCTPQNSISFVELLQKLAPTRTCISIATVMGPTPPGTGVMKLALSLASVYATSPTIFFPFGFVSSGQRGLKKKKSKPSLRIAILVFMSKLCDQLLQQLVPKTQSSLGGAGPSGSSACFTFKKLWGNRYLLFPRERLTLPAKFPKTLNWFFRTRRILLSSVRWPIKYQLFCILTANHPVYNKHLLKC